MRHARRTSAVALALTVAACARDRSSAADTAIVAGASQPTGAAAGAKPGCPGTGHWTSCTSLARLESAGVAPQITASLPDLPALAVKPALYTVGRSGLAIYLFADSTARARAARALDTLRFVGAARALTMRGETTAIQNDNLLALLFSRSEQQRERVADAFMAGPPQPAAP